MFGLNLWCTSNAPLMHMCWMLIQSNYYKQSTMLIVNYHSKSGNLTNSNHHWHTVVTAPHSILATLIGLFVRFRTWTMKVQAVNYSSKLQSPNFQGSCQLKAGCPMSRVQCRMSLLYFMCWFLEVSSVFTQPLSTAVSTHLITYATATFHLGKFGDDRHSSFVIRRRKEIFGRSSAELRHSFGLSAGTFGFGRTLIRACSVHF